MHVLTKNYDRVLLTVAAIIAIAFGALLTRNAFALSGTFDRPTVVPEDFTDEGVNLYAAALEHTQREHRWETPTLPGVPEKRLALLQSTPLLVKGGKVYDLLDARSAPLRPPLTNLYLHQHQLPAERSDVASLDHDSDGFTNLEEFLGGKTDPRDAADHPPFINKLRLAEIRTDNYSLTFTGGDPKSGFNVRELAQPFGQIKPIRKSSNESMGNTLGKIGAARWQVVGYESKEELNAKIGGMQDASELIVSNLENRGAPPLRLKLGTPHEMPTHRAVFYLDLPGQETTLSTMPTVGESFELPCEPGVRYELLAIGSNGAQVRRSGGGGAAYEVPPSMPSP
jgi:hypothetical protein